MPGRKQCGDQKLSGGRKECEAGENQRMSGVDGKEQRAVAVEHRAVYWGLHFPRSC